MDVLARRTVLGQSFANWVNGARAFYWLLHRHRQIRHAFAQRLCTSGIHRWSVWAMRLGHFLAQRGAAVLRRVAWRAWTRVARLARTISTVWARVRRRLLH